MHRSAGRGGPPPGNVTPKSAALDSLDSILIWDIHLVQDLDLHALPPGQMHDPGGMRRQVEHTPAEWAAVVYAHLHRQPGCQVRHAQLGAERQPGTGAGERV